MAHLASAVNEPSVANLYLIKPAEFMLRRMFG